MNKSQIAASVGVIVLVSFGFYYWHENDGSNADAHSTQQTPDARPVSPAAIPPPIQRTSQLPAPPVGSVPASDIREPAIRPAPVDPTDPKLRNALERDRTIGRYSAFYQRLGLSAATSDRLTQLLMDDREAGVDFAAASARYGKDVGQDHQAYVGSVTELRARIQDEIRGLLGNEGYAAFQQADLEIRQSAIIERVQGRLNSGAALTATQATNLLSVLKEFGVHNLNDEVLARARTFLSPPQMEVLTEIRNRQQMGPKKDKVQQAISEYRTPVPTPPTK